MDVNIVLSQIKYCLADHNIITARNGHLRHISPGQYNTEIKVNLDI